MIVSILLWLGVALAVEAAVYAIVAALYAAWRSRKLSKRKTEEAMACECQRDKAVEKLRFNGVASLVTFCLLGIFLV